MITTEIDDKKVKITINHVMDASRDMKRPFRIIAQEMRESVRENFEVGGRYSTPGSIIVGGKTIFRKKGRIPKQHIQARPFLVM